MYCRTEHRPGPRRGAVLVLVLALMGIFSLLGLYYVRYMVLENEGAELAVREIRARQLATAGVEAALGQLRAGMAEQRVLPLLGKSNSYDLPTYQRLAGSGLEDAPHAREDRIARATASIYDESGKLNLNHAPASMLQAVLGVDGATARAITSSRPNLQVPAHERTGAWLLSADELVTRGLLSEEQYAAIDTSLLTTYSVLDHENPVGWLNVNSCPAEVLAAIVGLPAEQGPALAEKRPFNSLAALVQAAGKDPATFNMPPSPENPTALPEALSFASRCFRVVSTGEFAEKNHAGDPVRPVRRTLEAVVLFDDTQTPEVVAWTMTSGDAGA